MDVMRVLRRIELFHTVTDEQLTRIAAICRLEEYNEGEVILKQDSPGDTMYVIAQGQVEVGRVDEEGDFFPFVYLGDGQVFGEVALLDHGRRTASVRADVDGTVVHAIDRDAFLSLCREDTALGFAVMFNLATDLAFKLRHNSAGELYADKR